MFDRMRILILTGIIVVVDQITKLAIRAAFGEHESLELLGDFLRFTHVENPGMAFGISLGGKYFLTVFATIASLVILHYLYLLRHERLRTRLSLALILGGAAGNLIDRYVQGTVTDFIDVDFFDIHIPPFSLAGLQWAGYDLERWPVFNVADSAVTIGMVMLIVFVLFERETPHEQSKLPAFVAGEPAPSEENDKWREVRKP